MHLYGPRQRFFNTDGAAGAAAGGDADPEKLKERLAYLETESKQAYKDRDAAKQTLKRLQESGAVLSDEDRQLFDKLKKDAAAAEEAAAKKAGEYDKLTKQLADKYAGDLKDRDGKIDTLSTRLRNTLVEAEFGKAGDLFGGESAKTILDVEMAIALLGRYVVVEDAEDSPRGYRVVVKNTAGETIVGKDGKPAPFGEAITEVITALPNKDRILRGSGKTGSGSSGGAVGGTERPLNLFNLTPDQLKDPKVLEQLRKLAPTGGLVMGEAYR